MKAHEIRASDEFREGEKLIYTVLTDAEQVDGQYNDIDEPTVRVLVRYEADGGHTPRFFDADAEVPITRGGGH